MSFEEEFPGLHNDCRYCNFPLSGESAFSVGAIKSHCLDKQRVKEAWIKLLKNINQGKEPFEVFEKELGLNDEQRDWKEAKDYPVVE